MLENGLIAATQSGRKLGDYLIMLLPRRLRKYSRCECYSVYMGQPDRYFFYVSCWNRCEERHHCAKAGHNSSGDTIKCFYCTTNLEFTLRRLFKFSWKRWNGKPELTRFSPKILHHPIITVFVRWHVTWLISSSMKYECIEKWLDSWNTSIDEHFYRKGILALPERWQKVVSSDGKNL